MRQPLLGDFIAAGGAPASLAFIEPREHRFDPGAFGYAAAGCRLRHRLLLQRVHPAEAADAVLLQLHRVARIGIDRVLGIERLAAGQQTLSRFVFGYFLLPLCTIGQVCALSNRR